MDVVSQITKALQIFMIEGSSSSMTRLIAMQKVVGSNPISRFFANALHLTRIP
jgi:hypothetical protein